MSYIQSSLLEIDSPYQDASHTRPLVVLSEDSPVRSFSGKLTINSDECIHSGIDLELTGIFEPNNQPSSIIHQETRSLASSGTLRGSTLIAFDYHNQVATESYHGKTFKIRYILSAFITLDNEKIKLDEKEIFIVITGNRMVMCMILEFNLAIPDRGEIQVMLNNPAYSTSATISAMLKLVDVEIGTSFRLSLKRVESLKVNGEITRDVEHVAHFTTGEEYEDSTQYLLDLSSLELSPSTDDTNGAFEVGYEVWIEGKTYTEGYHSSQPISLFRSSYS
jgi:hypothetical protein